ncbi:universal stress family protein [Corallococcus coralloides DSM 2259]|uniref:Universal stress family protein n=1 Tax=Corallococcus coralloides (strain ATCC 25202 / DSM 2259 / NBRC 100086 / M2) TaxID=1144275 RepID=H8MX95_CORCM|nr:universal stress protein [Corallococcus coralloides]AFE10810.1 universal stress family protein [Corallococcus coralloides DSM 2259]
MAPTRKPLPLLRTVLVATDFSPAGARAVERTARLPLAPGAAVTLVHALPGRAPREFVEQARERAGRTLAVIAQELHASLHAAGSSASVEARLVFGKPAPTLVRQAQSAGTDLIVLGRHGRRPVRDLFLGSTAEHVIRYGPSPVLVVHGLVEDPYRRPLVAVDAEETARHAAGFLPALVEPRISLRLIHAYESPLEYMVFPGLTLEERARYRERFKDSALRQLRSLHRHLDALGLHYRQALEHGSPYSIILKEARRHRADLLALGTQARSGLSRVLLGSVATDVIREAGCDVLVVRPPA